MSFHRRRKGACCNAAARDTKPAAVVEMPGLLGVGLITELTGPSSMRRERTTEAAMTQLRVADEAQ
jgi:hypothetical protein